MSQVTVRGTDDLIAYIFSDKQAYSKDEYCIYEGYLYKFTADKAVGAWSTSTVEKVTVAEELSDIKKNGVSGGTSVVTGNVYVKFKDTEEVPSVVREKLNGVTLYIDADGKLIAEWEDNGTKTYQVNHNHDEVNLSKYIPLPVDGNGNVIQGTEGQFLVAGKNNTTAWLTIENAEGGGF